MRFPFRECWKLRAIERELRLSEPHLAGMLTIFAKLNAGEAVISGEQADRRGERVGDAPNRTFSLMAVRADGPQPRPPRPQRPALG